MSKIILAIDGHSGCGKSTTAKRVAARLGYVYVDTGAMYRAVTLFFLQHNVSLTDTDAVQKALADLSVSFRFNADAGRNETYLNDVNVEDEIRTLHVANFVSKVSALPQVRQTMIKLQHQMGEKRGLVMDGRDIGTHVFPDAECKIFMTADPLIRAQRRQAELLDKGEIVGLNEILSNIQKRDHDDTTRSVSPLRRADDAILLDTSFITISEQVERVLQIANKRVHQLETALLLETADVLA